MPSNWWKELSRTTAAALIVLTCSIGGALAVSDDGDDDDSGDSGGSSSSQNDGDSGGGDGDDGRTRGSSADPSRVSPDGRTVCREGMFYNIELKICQRLASVVPDDRTLYKQGRTLALAGDYTDALSVFDAIADKNDAMVLTMMGYATRKLGRLDEGIALYHQALAIEPDNLNTREYLGEGYLDAGRVDLAEAELDTLERLCGTDCSQYRALARVLNGNSVWN